MQSHVIALATLSNRQMDCDWGFVCAGGLPLTDEPIFHLTTQDALHRLSGWVEFAHSRVRGHTMLFTLFASTYSPRPVDDLPGNMRAFTDFRLTLIDRGYVDLNHVPALTPPGVLANVGLQESRSRSGDVLAMACWTGVAEVEGIAVYDHGNPIQRGVALRDLTRQMRAAVAASTST